MPNQNHSSGNVSPQSLLHQKDSGLLDVDPISQALEMAAQVIPPTSQSADNSINDENIALLIGLPIFIVFLLSLIIVIILFLCRLHRSGSLEMRVKSSSLKAEKSEFLPPTKNDMCDLTSSSKEFFSKRPPEILHTVDLYRTEKSKSTLILAPQERLYRALYNFEGHDSSMLALNVGMQVEVIDKQQDWWKGLAGDISGWFPSSYVEPLKPGEVNLGVSIISDDVESNRAVPPVTERSLSLPASFTAGKPDSAMWWAAYRLHSLKSKGVSPDVLQKQYLVKHIYKANASDELSVIPGDVLLHLNKDPNGWIKVKNKESEKEGWVPGACVADVKELKHGKSVLEDSPLSEDSGYLASPQIPPPDMFADVRMNLDIVLEDANESSTDDLDDKMSTSLSLNCPSARITTPARIFRSSSIDSNISNSKPRRLSRNITRPSIPAPPPPISPTINNAKTDLCLPPPEYDNPSDISTCNSFCAKTIESQDIEKMNAYFSNSLKKGVPVAAVKPNSSLSKSCIQRENHCDEIIKNGNSQDFNQELKKANISKYETNISKYETNISKYDTKDTEDFEISATFFHENENSDDVIGEENTNESDVSSAPYFQYNGASNVILEGSDEEENKNSISSKTNLMSNFDGNHLRRHSSLSSRSASPSLPPLPSTLPPPNTSFLQNDNDECYLDCSVMSDSNLSEFSKTLRSSYFDLNFDVDFNNFDSNTDFVNKSDAFESKETVGNTEFSNDLYEYPPVSDMYINTNQCSEPSFAGQNLDSNTDLVNQSDVPESKETINDTEFSNELYEYPPVTDMINILSRNSSEYSINNECSEPSVARQQILEPPITSLRERAKFLRNARK